MVERNGTRLGSGSGYGLRFYLAVCLVILFVSVVSVVEEDHHLIVSGDSMEPTYHAGEHLVARTPKSTYDLEGNPVCWIRLEDGHDVIKRLIGYPGQTVHLRDGDVYVDGVLLMERTGDSWDNGVFHLGSEDYLFLGDNRSESHDGRHWYPWYPKFDDILGVIEGSQLEGVDR